MMDSSNEFNYEETRYQNQIERIEMNETFKYNLIADNGDVIDCLNNTDQKDTADIDKNMNDEENIILSEKVENPYESSSYPWSIYNQSQESISYPLFMHQLSHFDIECSSTSTNLMLPQFIQNHIKSSHSFQQLWSPRVYSPKLIDSNTPQSTLSILWSLIILLSKLILTGLIFCTKILRYDTILFSFCYIFGALFGMNAYFLIDFLLILICIISIMVATYEKWLVRYVNLNDYINGENDNRYWKQIKLAAYGLSIGTISTFFM